MFPDKPPFSYKCTKCGHYFSSDKNLHAPSIFSSIPLDFENNETSENGDVITKVTADDDNKKDSFFTKIIKNITYPKCPKCKEHAVVSIDSMIEK